MQNYLGIDQYNQHYMFSGKYPRKALLDELGATKAEKMYTDKKNGTTVCIGYIIKGLWIHLYKVEQLEVKI